MKLFESKQRLKESADNKKEYVVINLEKGHMLKSRFTIGQANDAYDSVGGAKAGYKVMKESDPRVQEYLNKNK